MDEGVRNSDGTEAQSGTRFGGLGRLRVLSMMVETSSKEGWMLVWVGGQLLVLCCTACLPAHVQAHADTSRDALTWGAIFAGCMLGHGSRGGEEDESAHRMQHVCTAERRTEGMDDGATAS